jgi:hypothetical protein
MKHVWNSDDWNHLRLGDVKNKLFERTAHSPRLGDLSVRDLCCLAQSPWTPVGIYIFTQENRVLYTGKTHGRSFHERMLSHIDHRDPIIGSPHLAQLVQSLIKRGGAKTADEAVAHILDMNITWLPILQGDLTRKDHQHLIAHTERRLLWSRCLDPLYNSPRVKKNDSFMLRGTRYYLSTDSLLGESVSG